MDNQVTLTIDGKTVRVPRGTLVVDAAKSVGITVPVFCYHEKMKPVGACRMCLVEIAPGPPLPQTACTTPVAEGMTVKTRSPSAVSAQKATIEFLLLNHPLDCPVCDRGGECPLQDNTFGYGGAESRFLEEKRHFEKPLALSDEVLLDRERCIMCYRCVRFCREIAGDESLTVIERGTESQIGLAPGRVFDSPFSGNTIEICPVGALTSARYRFVARPWDIRSVATICPHCPVGCNVRADVRGNEIKRFLSRENAALDDGWLCDRGRFGYEFPSRADRLTRPLLRRNGALAPATWSEAIEAVRAGLAAREPGTVAGLAGGQLTNEDLFMFRRLIRDTIGSPNLDHTLERHPGAPLGVDAAMGSVAGLDRSDVVVLVGTETKETHPVLYLRLRKAAARGARFVVIGPDAIHFDELRRAAQHLTAQAGGEASVVTALMRLIPAEQDAARERRRQAAEAAADRAFADAVKRAHDAAVAKAKEANEPEPAAYANPEEGGARYGIGRQAPPPPPEPKFRAREALLAGLGPAAEVPGVGQAELQAAARQIGGGERVSVLYPRERGVDGTLLSALTNLGMLTEAVNLMPLVKETNQQGAIDMGVVPAGGLGGAELFGAIGDGRVKALYVAGRDPGEAPGALEALSRLEFLVVQDNAPSATTELAHVVLPGLTFAEKDGTYTNLERRVQRLRPCLEPRGEARPDWRVFRDVANALGGQSLHARAEDVFGEIARSVPSYAEITYGRIGFRGQQWPFPAPAYEPVGR
ncbi:MAG TPA: NADH-quinone oxidoreductase subunit NuoG [Chloroflexota bacterium]